MVLWIALRDLMLWASTREDLRARLFSKIAYGQMRARLQGEEVPSDVQAPLLVLSEVLREGTGIAPSELAQAAVRVSRWAGEQSLPHTAISFAQAAALLLPERADLSYRVGLLCRTNGQYARAETWFRRTIVLARRREDAQSYALAWIGLGNLYMRRGQHHVAERAYLKALRKSKRSGIQGAKAMALHSLFCVAVETGRVAEAEFFAEKAAHVYKPTDSKLIILAHDIAALWLSQGFHSRALPVFCAVTPLLRSTPERLQALCILARAAAGADRKDIFTTVWTEAWWIIDQNPSMESVPTALVHLASASATLLDWERAELAGSVALTLASNRNEERARAEAEEVWKAVCERRLEDKLTTSTGCTMDQNERAELLAQRLVRKLSVCARKGVIGPRTDILELA
ncbi:MAG TPA: tetratricopeptide repeat protein [Longimicrobiaceae bacterium]